MLVLFSIAMVCFFSLFGMMVILLRQARAEGARVSLRRQRNRNSKAYQTSHVPDRNISSGTSRTSIDLSLSNLVPQKKPDWRFMVRESEQDVRTDKNTRKGPAPFHYDQNRTAYFSETSGDLTDPQSSNVARRA